MTTEKDGILQEEPEVLEDFGGEEQEQASTAGATEPSTEDNAEHNDGDSTLADELNQVRQQLLRVQADFDNFRRRTRQEREELQQFATRRLLEDLLPTVDNFERALSSLDDEAHDELKKGIVMVHRQLVTVLEQHGVQAMSPVDEAFDPNFHEAVMQEPADGREVGIVTEELQKGYTFNGKVLRPAMVKVTV